MMGCDKRINDTCAFFIEYNSVVIDNYIKTNICSKCTLYVTNKDGTTTCKIYTYYNCYSSYAVELYNTNKTCTVSVDYNQNNYWAVFNNLKRKYPIGGKDIIMYNTYIGTCDNKENVVQNADTGYFLLFVAIGVFIFVSYLHIKERNSKYTIIN